MVKDNAFPWILGRKQGLGLSLFLLNNIMGILPGGISQEKEKACILKWNK